VKTVAKTIVVLIALVAVGGLLFLYSGLYDVGALRPDNPVASWVLDTARERSVKRHARGVKVPPLTEPAMLKTGNEHYREMCEECHGGPGVADTDLSQGLMPPAPDLQVIAKERTPAELYWVVKNGIRMTGMPAWGPSHTEDKLWAMVAFVVKLPAMSLEDYRALRPAGAHDGTAESDQGPD
jgi:mono/diheme cytochrome c family protein